MAPQDPQAEQAAFSQQYDAQQAQQKAQETAAAEPPSLLQRWGAPVVHATMSVLDSAMSEAEQWGTAAKRVGQDVAAGTATAAANTMDAVKAAGSPDDPGDPANAPSPIWDHAKGAILDFRDAVAVKDPNIIDGLTQSVAQLAIPFMGYSRVLSGFHGLASIVAAGAATDSTALGPHDMRMADMMALGRHTEGKFGDALRTLAPDGSALNAYITYLGDRTNETEAEGRWKNVLDGFGVNMIATPLLAAAGTVLKQGTAGLRYAAENGVRNTVSDLFAGGPVAGSPESQAGKIGYHGTNAEPFERFDDSKIGSGEGNQSYGHGHYIADNPVVAGEYGNTLRVGVPDEVIGQMMDWHKPLSEQPEIARKLGVSLDSLSRNPNALRYDMTGQEVYQRLSQGRTNLGAGTSPQEASAFLNRKNITGLRYRDAGSRDLPEEEQTYNSVLFDPKHATIVKKE